MEAMAVEDVGLEPVEVGPADEEAVPRTGAQTPPLPSHWRTRPQERVATTRRSSRKTQASVRTLPT